MLLLWKRKEIIGKKELNRRIEVIQKAKHYLKANGKVLWGGEFIYTEHDLYEKVIDAVGKKHAKKQFENIA